MTHGQREWSYDVFPCPIDLCELLLDVSILYKASENNHASEADRLDQARTLLHSLHRWTYGDLPTDEPRTHLIEAWRLGIMAYAWRLFPRVHRSPGIEPSPVTDRLFYHATSIALATSASYASLWPIFQVAVSLDDDAVDKKAWVRNYLQVALGTVGCRHFSNALEALEIVWEQRGSHGVPVTGTYGRTIMLG